MVNRIRTGDLPPPRGFNKGRSSKLKKNDGVGKIKTKFDSFRKKILRKDIWENIFGNY